MFHLDNSLLLKDNIVRKKLGTLGSKDASMIVKLGEKLLSGTRIKNPIARTEFARPSANVIRFITNLARWPNSIPNLLMRVALVGYKTK